MTDIDHMSIEELEAHWETLRLAQRALTGKGALRPGHPDHARYREIDDAMLELRRATNERAAAGQLMPPETAISAALRAAQAVREPAS